MSEAVTRNPSVDTSQPYGRYWEDPELTGVNRLPGRGTLLPYASAEAATAGRPEDARTISLDGDWAFRRVERPEDTPDDFADPTLDDSGWDRVAVPGNFTMQGHGHPQYTNVQMPFAPNRPPFVPEQNPTGLYRKAFSVPDDWDGRRIVLRIGALTSCGQVRVNGAFVGIVKDSRLPSEFDVTAVVRPGENLLAVQVIQWSDASYIEDQDQWWQAGIQRSVSLYATAPTFLADVAAIGSYDHANGSGHLAVEVAVGGLPAFGWQVTATLLDPEGQPALGSGLSGGGGAWQSHAGGEMTGEPRPKAGDLPATGVVTLDADLPSVRPWSAEIPDLYTLVIGLYDPEGREVEATRARIGFRSVRIENRELLVNGKPVYIKGVNRHEHHDRFGSAVPRETVERDVAVLKAFNVNAVRTSHYPPDPYFLDLADEHGLYVIDEANIESHANFDTLCDDPRYQAAFLDRISRMVLRDRNHPSVIAWSLGNESGYGCNHDAAAAWVRRTDPSRIVHYEGAITGHRWEGGHAATDLLCPMYPSIDSIVEWVTTTDDRRPLIMCEYAHAMGNSCGNLADYWEAIESHHGLQGGFIWEMLDHGIVKTARDGREYWGYGGDFGDQPNDGNFVCDGLFWPSREAHPAMWEAKRVFQPFDTELADDGGRIEIRNKYDFRDLSHLSIGWRVEVDGTVVASGSLAGVETPAGEVESVPVPWSVPELEPGQEAYVRLGFTDPEGHEVGWTQHRLAAAPMPESPTVQGDSGTVEVTPDSNGWELRGGRLLATVRRSDGALTSWSVDGVELLAAGCEPTIFRAPIDNDGVQTIEHGWRPMHQAYFRWLDAGLDNLEPAVESVDVSAGENGRAVLRRTIRYTPAGAPNGSTAGYTYDETLTFAADGSIAAEHAFAIDAELPDLARVGVIANVARGFERVEWYGRGPHESYVDRKLGAAVSRWSGSVDEQHVPYIFPQENGGKSDTRWLALRREDGVGLLVSADSLVQAKVSHYSDANLHAARHTVDLVRDDVTYLAIDAHQRGLGGASCGPDTLERYRIPSGQTYHLAYRLLPLGADDDPATAHRR